MPFKLKHINWKYIFGEILLLFVGINLAIWFNDWNASKSIQKDKEVALVKIKEEIEANREELVANSAENQKIPAFFAEMDSLQGNNDLLVTSVEVMQGFVGRYPQFFQEIDSSRVEDGLYQYEVGALVNLEISDLSSIAWEIAKSTGIFHEFGYECLYELQSLYNTQDLVKIELNNATTALRNGSMKELVRVLNVMGQLEDQLEGQYEEMIQSIDNCK
ncbi:hypothetical protein [Flagellimonas flava]|uniref:hypothetical protein n=1 Tax=Flagellimonas flava TaxID=570519 RepID=UPI003D646852